MSSSDAGLETDQDSAPPRYRSNKPLDHSRQDPGLLEKREQFLRQLRQIAVNSESCYTVLNRHFKEFGH